MTTAVPPRSRRERPAKPALSRQGVVDATLAVVRRDGLAAATMRRVAQELDTGAASLYVHIANTAELHAAVIDELAGHLPRPAASQPPGDRARALVTAYRDLLLEHPGLARSALVVRPDGPHVLALLDELLGALLELGADPVDAARGIDLLLQLATATAAEHTAPGPGDVDAGVDRAEQQNALTAAVRGADPASLPHLAAHADAVMGGTPGERWAWALDVHLTGITTVCSGRGAAAPRSR